MEIAFNAERGIQDAIEELSESESTTVVISYSVMFIYVAIALGSFRSIYTLLVSIGLVSTSNFMTVLLNWFFLLSSERFIRNSLWHSEEL